MLTLKQWPVILASLIGCSCLIYSVESKVYERCELAKILRERHRLDLQEVAQWVCIAQHSSGLNTASQAYSSVGGSHGLFQISDVYWCSPPGKGFGCNVPCHKLRDDDLTDDLSCVKRIYAEHQRISGDGFTAWNAYEQHCKNDAASYIQNCFPAQVKGSTYLTPSKGYNSHALQFSGNSIEDDSSQKHGKVYGRCELARELYHKYSMPMDQVPTWVCIAEHESHFNTAAVGRLNSDGSADHGLFQVSDLYWCSHDHYSGGGKACGLPCSKLLDNDISDDVRCVKRIHNEHTAISGDGFNAWTVYKPYCLNQRYDHVASCFHNTPQLFAQAQFPYNQQTANPGSQHQSNPFLNRIHSSQTLVPLSSSHYQSPKYNDIYKSSSSSLSSSKSSGSSHNGKVYTRCSLAQELFFKHNFPIQDISTWVCIAEHESRFNTAAVGRLNTDGSADHGLFQISDRYWCSHDQYGVGKACNIPCDKLLDDDLRDDVKCIKIIHEEHTRLSGDGFNAWTVYKPHCSKQNIDHVRQCFDQRDLENNVVDAPHSSYDKGPTKGKGKIYNKCELAQELYHRHKMPMDQIPKWVCIAQHESSFNTAAVGRLNTDGSADHGLFQISDLYWCSHDQYGGKACNIPCDKLLDSDISDDVRCIKIIHEEHTRISGDGFNAWTVYKPHCRNTGMDHIKSCFSEHELKQTHKTTTPIVSNSIQPKFPVISKTPKKGKTYNKCELAKELYHQHHMPMDQIPKWVCIAQHESSFNTAAVGRLNTDGSADHGLFQISDLYWCSHDQYGGKACNIPCDKLLDSDISDDVRCIKIIHEEHTRISGDGFNAWTVYKPHCSNTGMDHIKSCFSEQELKQTHTSITPIISNSIQPQFPVISKTTNKGKIYNKCELAKELYHQHQMPMDQIPKWVCIAQHESSFNTAAVGRLNTDGSADHGLFQISDLYWCSHDQYGGKACNIPCDKLLDSDISDDVRCIKIIYEEHTRISGDGFNAWTVYKPHCSNTGMDHIKSCFSEHELKQTHKTTTPIVSNSIQPQFPVISKTSKKGKIYNKCELAKELYHQHHMPMDQIPKWVCIAQHESSFNTAAVGRLNTDGSADHGIFQISDLYWCSHDQYGGKACNIPCDKLLDSDISDDVRCIKIIHEEHTRISGDGFNAWTVYKPHCRNTGMDHIKSCFSEHELKQTHTSITPIINNSIQPQFPVISKTTKKGKIYNKCELAKELYHQHQMPMDQIPKWVCIAQHESSFNTAAVGRLNTDGSADHGLFQISDLYWCSHGQYGGKACNIPCNKLLDSDISDDVRCIKIIYEEHTRMSGDGFNAWTVYKPHCRNTGMDHIKSCFSEQELKQAHTSITPIISNSIQPQFPVISKTTKKGKIYNKCELAKELYHQHHMPMDQIPKWVCIAQHESSFNTAAVGRLNTDGSADHGLFQISDLYWCSHDQYGGKACNIPCDKLLDSDISDDVRCIKIIYEEHTRISGDGFNAWTVYKPHCRNRKMDEIRSCFTGNEIEDFEKDLIKTAKPVENKPHKQSQQPGVYDHNPFLAGFHGKPQSSLQKPFNQDFKTSVVNQKQNYASNPFLQNVINQGNTQSHKNFAQIENQKPSYNNNQVTKLEALNKAQQNYQHNPFLNGILNSVTSIQNSKQTAKQQAEVLKQQQQEVTTKPSYNSNPFLNGNYKPEATNNVHSKPSEAIKLDNFNINPFLNGNIKLSALEKPTSASLSHQHNPFLQNIPTPTSETNKNYLNSNDFRTTTTTRKPTIPAGKPITTTTTTKKPTNSWTTTGKPITLTSLKATTNWNTFTNQNSNTSWKTTTKSATTRKTTTRKPATTSGTSKTPKSTTNWRWQNQKYANPTVKPSTTTRSTTTKLPKTSTTLSWKNQKYANPTTMKTTITLKITTKKPATTPWTTRTPTNTTSWNWQNQKPLTTWTTTTKLPKTTKSTTKTWNWQNERYSNTTTTKSPQAITKLSKTTTRAATTRNWLSQNYINSTTKPTALPKGTTNWNVHNLRTTAKPGSTKLQTFTTTKPQKTTWNWRNEQYTKTTKTSAITTKKQSSLSTTTKKTITTTLNWRVYDKTTAKPNEKSTAKTAMTTIKPTMKSTLKSTTTKPTTRRTSTTTKLPTLKTLLQQTLKPTKPVYSENRTTLKSLTAKTTKAQVTTQKSTKPIHNEYFKTTTLKPRTTKPQTTTRKAATKPPTVLQNITKSYSYVATTLKPFISDYEKFKNDPFQHPFFDKVNEKIKQLKANTTTTKRPNYTATKLQSFPESPFHKEYKNIMANKTKTIVSYNSNGQNPTTTQRPRL